MLKIKKDKIHKLDIIGQKKNGQNIQLDKMDKTDPKKNDQNGQNC